MVDNNSPSDGVKYVRTMVLENGITFHSWVIGLPFFEVCIHTPEEMSTNHETTSVN